MGILYLKDLTDRIADRLSSRGDFQKNHIEWILRELFSEIHEELDNGNKVSIKNFGTFQMKRKGARTARDICKNRIMVIPERMVPHFEPSKKLKDISYNVGEEI